MVNNSAEAKEERTTFQPQGFELLAIRFQVAEVLKTQRRLQATTQLLIWEDRALHAIPPEAQGPDFVHYLSRAVSRFETYRERLDRHQRHVLHTIGELHRYVIRVASLYSDDAIQEQCELILHLPLPTCPPPGDDVDSLAKSDEWFSGIIARLEEDIHPGFLSHIDTLAELLKVKTITAQSSLD